MAQSVRLIMGEKYNAEQIIEKLGLPLFVKPSAGGNGPVGTSHHG